MNIKYIKSKILLFAIIFVLGCSKNPSSNITNDFVEKIAVIEGTLPSKYVQYNLYVKTTDEALILVTNVNFLSIIYRNRYQNNFKDFHNFLQAVLKHGFKLDAKDAANYDYHTFTKNPVMMKLSTKEIIEKYFQQEIGKDKFNFYPKSLSTDETQTILYKMFLEGYLVSFNDYGGNYIIKKY